MSQPYRIAVINDKGGVGKTTTSVLLAVALARQSGKRVAIENTDGQGSSVRWISRLVAAGESPGKLGLCLYDARRKRAVWAKATHQSATSLDVVLVEDKDRDDAPEIIVTDTPPAEGRRNDYASLPADLFVIPLLLSSEDMNVALGTLQSLRVAFGKGVDARLLFNRVKSGSSDMRDIKAFRQQTKVPAFDAVLFDSRAIARAQVLGWTALTRAGASAPVKAVADEVIAIIGGASK